MGGYHWISLGIFSNLLRFLIICKSKVEGKARHGGKHLNPSIERQGWADLCEVWHTQHVPDQLGIHKETLSQKIKTKITEEKPRPLIPALGRQSHVDLFEFKAS